MKEKIDPNLFRQQIKVSTEKLKKNYKIFLRLKKYIIQVKQKYSHYKKKSLSVIDQLLINISETNEQLKRQGRQRECVFKGFSKPLGNLL